MSGLSSQYAAAAGLQDEFHALLLDILRTHPLGLSEYELFNLLAERGESDFDRRAWQSEHALFCRHFLLFHALYRLRDLLHEQQLACLEISALRICLSEWRESVQSLTAAAEPLREFYLDITQLEKFSASDVQEMLGRFWLRFHNNECRREALAVLELADPVSDTDIKQRFRRLAMQHHPDRGGDSSTLQKINAAMNILTR
ncbi:DNA-J related domain-containing protein [Sulfuriflexus sp.]|uniref:DNA-J related domain-containing protein n=1 Tax=Sulfuriflexus sp. TaxID=2015443 RepID=UPI0028CC13BB|nr:DNA-J related domain-containing protein [Sulfuriflexus sp.]MDT8403862.1 DNA-J related domain-containing protein [Sulfuriflexus sp.]